jgi:hypothetical protein
MMVILIALNQLPIGWSSIMVGETSGHYRRFKALAAGTPSRLIMRLSMKNLQWPVFCLAVSILMTTSSIGPILQASTMQSTEPKNLDRMPREVFQYLAKTTRDLGIDILIIDKITLAEAPVYTDTAMSLKDRLDIFISYLRDNGARLVKSGIVYQIVPLSQNSDIHSDPIADPADISSIQPKAGGRISIRYEGAFLPNFCNQIAGMLNIMPIVIDPALTGRVNLLTGPIPKESLAQILMTILDNNGAMIIERSGEYQIVPKSKELPGQWKILTNIPSPDPSPTR